MSVKSRSHETVHEPSSPSVILAKEDLHDEGSVDPVYQAKARMLNQALQEIGMGKYQVRISTDFPWRLHLFQFSGVYSLLQVLDGSRECLVVVPPTPWELHSLIHSPAGRDSAWPVSSKYDVQ